MQGSWRYLAAVIGFQASRAVRCAFSPTLDAGLLIKGLKAEPTPATEVQEGVAGTKGYQVFIDASVPLAAVLPVQR